MSGLACDIMRGLLDACELDVEDKRTFMDVVEDNYVDSRDGELAHRALSSVSNHAGAATSKGKGSLTGSFTGH